MADDTALPWDVTFEEAPDGKFTKRNPKLYRALIQQLASTVNPANGKSQIATVTVVTGEPMVVGKKRRGKTEREEENAFREAGKERGFGLRIDPTHRGDGRTDLRIQIQPKKEFSAEAIASRTAKLEAHRAAKRAEKEREQKLAANTAAGQRAQGAVKK